MLGQRVATLVNRKLAAGTHRVAFDARDLNSGTYVYRIEAGAHSVVRKMVLIK